MTRLTTLLQVMPPPKMPPIPWWLVAFAIVALTFAAIWMLVLVLHAAKEERQARAQEQGLKR